MKKVTIIGKYISEENVVGDGQSIKTRIVTQEIEKQLTPQNVNCIDTYGWKKHPGRLMKDSFLAVRRSDNVIFMTDEGGIKVFPWLLLLSNLFGKCSLHYVVVGGWLTHFLKNHSFLRLCLKKFQGIYVETTVMRRDMEALGFQNILLMPNCKKLNVMKPDYLPEQYQEPYRLCVFSRIMLKKGIDDAVEAVRWVNNRLGRTVYTLDIYGQVDSEQIEWFAAQQQSFPPEIRYCGIAPYAQSVEVLKGSFALLFPTEFFTEGVPGTIIDAYAAGVPVIASRWESFADVVEDGITGIGYRFQQQKMLRDILQDLAINPERLKQMRYACLEKAECYLPDRAMRVLLDRLT